MRNDQQKTSKYVDNIIDSVDSMIDISKLKSIILSEFKESLNIKLEKNNVINDIVFIFTFFGDDFLHKLESINVKQDIKFITDIYGTFLKKNKNDYIYILQKNNNITNINYNNFLLFLKLIIPFEDYFLKRNYLLKPILMLEKNLKM